MKRYVLLYRNADPDPEDLDRIVNTPGLTVVDHTVKRALLIEASEEAVAGLRSQLKNWIVGEEVSHPHPGPPRNKVQRKDED